MTLLANYLALVSLWLHSSQSHYASALDHNQQILVVYTNHTLSTHEDDYNITNLICTINKNESNHKSFSSLYIITDPNMSNEQNPHNMRMPQYIPISFYHIINANELPRQCVTQTENTQNIDTIHTNLVQTPPNHNLDKIFANEPILFNSCPTQAWDFFVWSLTEWYLIYIFVLLIGMILGSLMILIIIFCCWKRKKDKFIKQIIDEYKSSKSNLSKKSLSIKVSNLSMTDNKHNSKNSRKKQPKYASIPPSDISHKKRHKSTHALHNSKKSKDKKRRKTLPNNNNNLNICDEKEKDHLLNTGKIPSRMKSNSDPFNPHRKSRKSRHKISKKKHGKSIGNLKPHKHKSKSRSRSPWHGPKSNNKYEQYRFTGPPNSNHLLKVDYSDKHRHSSKSKERKYSHKSRNKKKRKRSKSPMNDIGKNVTQTHQKNNSFGLPKLPPIPPEPSEATEMVTKKSIGINLAKMKARNYEENRREQPRKYQKNVNGLEMEVVKGIGNVSMEQKEMTEGNETKDEIAIGSIVSNIHKSHHLMPSLTNVNDEGIGAIDHIIHIISDRRLSTAHENDESSSFTMSGNDIVPLKKTKGKNDENKDKNSGVFQAGKKTKRYRLPKAITKGQWL